MATRQFTTPDGFVNETTAYEYATPIGFLNETASGGGTVTAVGSSDGVATAQATSAATSAQVASSAGVATAQATGASTSAQVASSAGTVTASDFVNGSNTLVTAVGSSSGSTTTSDFISALINSQVGSSAGSVTVADFINGTATLVTAVGSADGVATVLGISQQASTDTHDGIGFDPYARKRKAKGGKRKKEVEDLLARLMGLVPEDPPEEVAEAVEVAKATVERISAPQVDYTDQIAALQTAQLQLAKLDALLRSYEDEEEDDDLLLMSM